jgi:hypothetical protein
METNGYFGFLGNKLLDMISTEGGFCFITNDEVIINKYGFVFDGYGYRLITQRNVGIDAFWLKTYCAYNKGVYDIETINHNGNNTVYLFPDRDTHLKLGLNPHDDGGIGVNLADWRRDVEEIWQVREPIEGFVFDVAPIVYIKKKDEPYDEEKWKRISETGSDE